MKHILVYGMTENPGGIESYVMGLFRRNQGTNLQIDFLCDFPSIAYSEEIREKNGCVYYIPSKSSDLRGHLRKIRAVLKEHPEYRTVYFNVLDAGSAVTMLIPFLMGRRIVVHSHNSNTDKQRLHRICKPFLKFFSRKGRASCARDAAIYMFDTDKNVQIIPNVVDAEKYAYSEEVRHEMRRELQVEDHFVICHIGRLSDQKNPRRLIEIFEEVYKKDSTAILLSVGGGEQFEEIMEYARSKGLEQVIQFLGVRSDVPRILQAADVFLFPSLYEGLSIAALEAQASGIPCVFSDTVAPETEITDVVRWQSLKDANSVWADTVTGLKRFPRRSQVDAFIRHGFDISCCESYDRELILKFR